MKEYYVYILASQRNGTLYTGVTSDLIRRVSEHKNGTIKGFTSKYKVNQLGYYDLTEDVHEAIAHEKRIKKKNRNWKLHLIESFNPNWNDLYESLLA